MDRGERIRWVEVRLEVTQVGCWGGTHVVC